MAFFTYREKMGMSWQAAMDEPYEEVERALLIWSLRDERAKLEEERSKQR